MTAILLNSRRTRRKLLLPTILAFAVVLVVAALNILAPSIQTVAPLILILDSGTWAAFCLVVLFAEVRQVVKLLVLGALALAVTLSIATQWFGFAAFLLAYFGAVLFAGSVLILAALRLFRRKPGLRALILSVTMVLMGATGMLLSAWFTKPQPPIPGQVVGISEELKYIHDSDQSDRFSGIWLIDPGRDRIRLQRVKALYQTGQITQPMDQYNAAMVYQHAACADDYKIAYELAKSAEDHGASAGPPGSKVVWASAPLSHMAYDRWQLSLGKSQIYGTQLMPVPIKKPCAPTR